MLTPDAFGPAERLHAALGRRYPQIAASIVYDADTGLPHVRVTYRRSGPMTVEWDGTAYRWRYGTGPWEVLHADPEHTADAIAPGMGLRDAPSR